MNCYMCDRLATSKQHVPPRCLFPESKDTDGADYRSHLITVPSCDEHNQRKSGDDEFLLVSLAGIIGNNSIGYRHQLTKVDRAVRRSAFRLLSEIFLAPPVRRVIDLGNNRFIEVLWGTPDHLRLTACFDRIARGIHRHHFGCNFVGKTMPLLGYVAAPDAPAANFHRFIADKTEMELQGKPRHGANPTVFYYQLTDADQFGLSVLQLVFYEGLKVYVGLIPATSVVPKHLGFELMKRGIPTVLTLGDKEYLIDIGSRERDAPP